MNGRKPRVLITGAGGTVAGHLLRGLAPDATLVPTYRVPPTPSSTVLDIRDARGVSDTFARLRPDLVLHPAAIAGPDYCETHQDEAFAVNVTGTRNVAEAALACGARVVFFSTDYVFDGGTGPYDEDSEPNPVNYYGYTKAKAEESIRGRDGWTILRLGLVYGVVGPSIRYSSDDVRIIDALGHDRKVAKDDTCARYPIHADDIVAMVRALLNERGRPMVHLSGPDQVTKLAFGQRIARAMGYDEGLVSRGTTAPVAPRPPDCRLVNSRPLGITLTRLDDGIARTKEAWLDRLASTR